jgi:thiamine-monophosphate kinase
MRSEFEFIQHIKKTFSLDRIGDDCAILPKDAETDMVVTADMLVDEIDFRLEWTTPEQLGWKVLAVSLSDIAAMGAEPRWSMLSIAVPQAIWSSDFLDRLYDGWFDLARQHNVELVGGDISKTSGKLVVDSMVGGEVPKRRAILRSTARPGDAIFVSGELGGAAAGLELLEDGLRLENELMNCQRDLVLRQLQPVPGLDVSGQLQSRHLASSMIDLSDGLSSDLAQICEQSRVGARIFADKLPLPSDMKQMHFSFDEKLNFALNGGEDFELLFTGSKEKILNAEIPEIHHIGDVTANVGIIELVRDGKTEILEASGFRHF